MSEYERFFFLSRKNVQKDDILSFLEISFCSEVMNTEAKAKDKREQLVSF